MLSFSCCSFSFFFVRRDKCKASAQARRARLDEAHRLARFRRDLAEWQAWISEKMQTATDESHRDLTNLPAKLKKHEAFEAELGANETLLDSMKTVSTGRV